MALPVLNDTNTGSESANTLTHTVNLPTIVNPNELLVVWMAFDGAPTVTWDNVTHGTWTSYIDTVSGTACKLVVYAKVASGMEGGGTLDVVTNDSEQSVHRSVAIGNWQGTLAGGVNCPSATTGAGDSPNPPVATDSWGSVDRKTIAIEGCDGSQTVSAYPTDYSLNQLSDNSAGAEGVGLGSAGRDQSSAGSQNPGTFTISASDDWVAATFSIRGADLSSVPNPPRFRDLDYFKLSGESTRTFTNVE